MAEPTVTRRLQRKFILMSTDAEMRARLAALVPDGWEMDVVRDLDEIGGWSDILLYRFMLLDLDDPQISDPVQIMRDLRTQHMLQIAVFCFGGGGDLRDEMRLNRADRFFERAEISVRLPQLLQQFAW